MKKFLVHFTTVDGEIGADFCYADYPSEVEKMILTENKNIKKVDSIVLVEKMP